MSVICNKVSLRVTSKIFDIEDALLIDKFNIHQISLLITPLSYDNIDYNLKQLMLTNISYDNGKDYNLIEYNL